MTVRILLGTLGAEWQRTLLDLAQSDGDLEIVGMAESAMDLLLQVEELQADVVVLSQVSGGEEPAICSHLMLEYPDVAVLLLPGTPRRNAIGAWFSAKKAGRTHRKRSSGPRSNRDSKNRQELSNTHGAS